MFDFHIQTKGHVYQVSKVDKQRRNDMLMTGCVLIGQKCYIFVFRGIPG